MSVSELFQVLPQILKWFPNLRAMYKALCDFSNDEINQSPHVFNFTYTVYHIFSTLNIESIYLYNYNKGEKQAFAEYNLPTCWGTSRLLVELYTLHKTHLYSENFDPLTPTNVT